MRWLRKNLTTLLIIACLLVAAAATYFRYEPTRDTVIRQTTPCQLDSTSRACADYITRISRDEPIRVTCIRYTRAAAIPLDECPALVKLGAKRLRQDLEQERSTNESTGGPDATTPDQPTSDDGAGGSGAAGDGDPGGGGDGGPAVPPTEPDPPATGGGGGSDPDDPGSGGGGGEETPPADTPSTVGGLGVQTPLDPTLCGVGGSLLCP